MQQTMFVSIKMSRFIIRNTSYIIYGTAGAVLIVNTVSEVEVYIQSVALVITVATIGF